MLVRSDPAADTVVSVWPSRDGAYRAHPSEKTRCVCARFERPSRSLGERLNGTLAAHNGISSTGSLTTAERAVVVTPRGRPRACSIDIHEYRVHIKP